MCGSLTFLFGQRQSTRSINGKKGRFSSLEPGPTVPLFHIDMFRNARYTRCLNTAEGHFEMVFTVKGEEKKQTSGY